MRRSFRSTVLALGLAAAMAPAALASPTQQSVVQDDDRLLYQGAGSMQQTLRTMKGAGVDMVRVTVLWKIVAERAYPSRSEIGRLGSARERRAAQRQRRRFRAGDSHTYPAGNWDKFDDLVRYARELNIDVLLNVTGPGPAWAHGKPPRSLRKYAEAWRPDAGDYKDFVRAVAERYTGRTRDENAGRSKLPRVSTWTLWNEPNQAGWLAPQWGTDPDTGLRIPEAAKRYRTLFHTGRSALNAAGHGGDRILLGELAPQGNDKKAANEPLTPGRFLREMFCVDANLRELRGRSARARDCARFGATRATGFAHHPYTKNVSPTAGNPDQDWFTMANIGELGKLLDAISQATGGKLPAGLPLWMTEFGFESSPPDPHQGVSLGDGALWSNQGEFLAWANPRLASQAQFLLSDAGPARQHTAGSKAFWKTYQSGLLFANGAAKPAFQAYKFPFLVGRAGDSVWVWGQVRYRPNGVKTAVRLEWRPNAQSPWFPASDVIAVDSPKGYFTALAPSPGPGEWRAVALGTGNMGVDAASLSRPMP
ncbi:MAG TPA: hypothetical protein VGV40_03625 [Solirubrobacteraceae bacterium]|nr:hypothetical protein [Solirubrobacteraceae bacterium]